MLKTVLICARRALFIQAGVYNNSHLIKNLFWLPKKNLVSFIRFPAVGQLAQLSLADDEKTQCKQVDCREE